MLVDDEQIIPQPGEDEAQIELAQDVQVGEGGLLKNAFQLCLRSSGLSFRLPSISSILAILQWRASGLDSANLAKGEKLLVVTLLRGSCFLPIAARSCFQRYTLHIWCQNVPQNRIKLAWISSSEGNPKLFSIRHLVFDLLFDTCMPA